MKNMQVILDILFVVGHNMQKNNAIQIGVKDAERII